MSFSATNLPHEHTIPCVMVVAARNLTRLLN